MAETDEGGVKNMATKQAKVSLHNQATRKPLLGYDNVDATNSTEVKQGNAQRELKTTKTKIIHTLVLYLAMFDMALVSCMMGSSLLDFVQLTNSDTATIAMIFSGRGIGFLLGSVISGFIIDKMNYWLLISIDKLLGGLFYILLPLCRNVSLLVTCTFAAGVMHGFSVTGCCSVILFIWGKENGPAIQGYNFVFGVGCMLAPLVIEPFLLKKTPDSEGFNTSSLFDNRSEAVTASIGNQYINLTKRPNPDEGPDSQIFYGYLIAVSFAFITCICALILFFRSDRKTITNDKMPNDQHERRLKAKGARMGLLILMLILLFTFYVSILGLESVNLAFLMTFSVKQLGWSKMNGAYVNSVFMGAFTFGRGVGIFAIKCFSATLLLFIDLLLCVLCSIILVIFVNKHWSVLWICVIGFGIGISTMHGLGFTWTERHIGVNPKVTSLIMVGGTVGCMGSQVMVGQLLEKVTTMSFTYVLLGFSLASLLLMMALQFTARKAIGVLSEIRFDANVRKDKPKDKL